MFFKCINCGHTMESGEEAVVVDNVEWVNGERNSEERRVCPICRSDIEEAVRCKECNNIHLEDELVNGYCDDCIELMLFRFKRDPIACFSVAKNAPKEKIHINSFLESMFSEEEIEQILLRELVQSSTVMPVDCTSFIESDKAWFVDTITANKGGD